MNFIYIYNYKINILNKIKYIISFSIGLILKFSHQKPTELTNITKNKNRIITLNRENRTDKTE